MTPYEAAEVLAIFGQADDYESLSWRVDMADPARPVTLLAGCSDLFSWATADAEQIEVADIPLLRQALADLAELGEEYELAHLFAARKRKMRPQKPCYKQYGPAVAALYDACCTERERAAQDERDRQFWLGVAAKVRAGDHGRAAKP